MASVTSELTTKRREPDIESYPVYQAAKLYAGTIIMLNATGYAIDGADTASCVFAGIALETIDNTAGASGAKYIQVYRIGLFRLKLGTAAITDVGTVVYILYNNEVARAAGATNDIPCGVVASYDSAGYAWIDIGRRA
jgi:hypothetical protein